jgi:Zn-dependent peptidase ImmA (M78 family)
VFYSDFPEAKSVSVDYNGYCIGMDKHLTVRDERVRLAHEIGHCETGSFYSRYLPMQNRQKLENKANKWAYEKLLPFAQLRAALHKGCRNAYELSEHFDLTEDFIKEAYKYYTETKGLTI